MERLTDKHFNKTLGYYMKCSGCCERSIACNECEEFEALVDRLGAIEQILGDDYDLDRLREAVEKQAEYEQFMERWKQVAEIAGDVKNVGAERAVEMVEADRDGRCVVLPCKPGDAVWVISKRGQRCVERWIVHRVYKRDVGGWYFDLKNMMLSQKRPNEFEMCKKAISSFGKTVFLTREAAEDALKGDPVGPENKPGVPADEAMPDKWKWLMGRFLMGERDAAEV